MMKPASTSENPSCGIFSKLLIPTAIVLLLTGFAGCFDSVDSPTSHVEPDPGLSGEEITGQLAASKPTTDSQNLRTKIDSSEMSKFETSGMIGAVVKKSKSGELLLERVVDGGVASRAGLVAGDVILKIDDKVTVKLSQDAAIGLIRGRPGTYVTLEINRSARNLVFSLTLPREEPALLASSPTLAQVSQTGESETTPAPTPTPIVPQELRKEAKRILAVPAGVLVGGMLGLGTIVFLLWKYFIGPQLRASAARRAEARLGKAGQLVESPAFRTEQLTRERPWPGLASFRQEDSVYFFGRRIETAELFRLIKSDALTLLFGKSGLGKSSLINAGLFPLLKEKGFHPVYLRFDHSENAKSLVEQFQECVTEAFPRPLESTLWEFFHRVTEGADADGDTIPIMVIDQFEEIFTLGRETTARRHRSAEFFDQLADLIQNSCPDSAQQRFETDRAAMRQYDFDESGFKIVLSMREEYLAFLDEARQPLHALALQRLRLTEMSGSQAVEAIISAGGHLIDVGVGENIVRHAAGQSVDDDTSTSLDDLEVTPALLSLICAELNSHRIRKGEPRISRALVSGTKEQILSDFYDSCFAGMETDMRHFVEDQLLTSTGYRDALAVEDALAIDGVTREGIRELISRRLLRLDLRGGAARLEIMHDVLVAPCRSSRDLRAASSKRLPARLLRLGSFADKTIINGLAVASALMTLVLYFYAGIAMFRETTAIGVGLVTCAIFSLVAAACIALAVSPLRRIGWIVRMLISLALLGIGVGAVVKKIAEMPTESDFDGPIGVVGILFICVVMPAIMQAIYLVSVFRRVFRVRYRRRSLGRR